MMKMSMKLPHLPSERDIDLLEMEYSRSTSRSHTSDSHSDPSSDMGLRHPRGDSVMGARHDGMITRTIYHRDGPDDLTATSSNPSSWELKDAICTFWVDEHGHILECCESVPMRFGYTDKELKGHPISLVLPRLAELQLMRNGSVNPRLYFLSHLGVAFQLIDREGQAHSCQMFVNQVTLPTGRALAVIVRTLDQ